MHRTPAGTECIWRGFAIRFRQCLSAVDAFNGLITFINKKPRWHCNFLRLSQSLSNVLFDLNFITHQIPFHHHPTARGPLWPGHLANIVRLHRARHSYIIVTAAAAATNKQLILLVAPNTQPLDGNSAQTEIGQGRIVVDISIIRLVQFNWLIDLDMGVLGDS